jgi:hypothetical protein
VPGAPDSKVGLYEGEGGERGVVALQPLAKGETVLLLPMRLAITDTLAEGVDEGEQGQEDGYSYSGSEADERPWSVRLAGKLLAMAEAGEACPWHPYLQVMPLLPCFIVSRTAGRSSSWMGKPCIQARSHAGRLAAPGPADRMQLPPASSSACPAAAPPPVLQVLPQSVPSPLTTLSWEDMQASEVRWAAFPAEKHCSMCASPGCPCLPEPRPCRPALDWCFTTFTLPLPSPPGRYCVQYEPMLRQLDHASWLAASAAQSGGGSFGRERWDWALSVRCWRVATFALQILAVPCLGPSHTACLCCLPACLVRPAEPADPFPVGLSKAWIH